MTLPTTGPISMDDVRFELDREASAISLNDTDVRTLAGKASGIITMHDLYGKQFYAPHRASSWYGYTNWAETTGSSAKDTTATTVDSSTEAVCFDSPSMSLSGGVNNAVIYYGFGNRKSYTGTLTVRWRGYTETNSVYDEEYSWMNTATSSISIEYSLDDGVNWVYMTGLTAGGTQVALTSTTFVGSVPRLDKLKVRISFQSQDVSFNGSPFFHAYAGFGIWVSDILLY